MKSIPEKLNTAALRTFSFSEHIFKDILKNSRKYLAKLMMILLILSLFSDCTGGRIFAAVGSAESAKSETGLENRECVIPVSEESGEIIRLSGMMPENSSAQAVDVTGNYLGEEAEVDLVSCSETVVAAYDISITDRKAEYQPSALYPVQVEIENPRIRTDRDFILWHIRDDGTKETVTDFIIEDGKISFAATGFSVYAIVDVSAPANPVQAETIEELSGSDAAEGFILCYGESNYFTSSVNSNNALVETTDISSAAVWYLAPVSGGYKIYTEVNGTPKYIYNTSGNNIGLGTEANADVIEISSAGSGTKLFYLKKSETSKWLQHSNGGKGIRYWTDNANDTNSRIQFIFANSLYTDNDRLGLNGKSYGIINCPGGTTGYAFMADSGSNSLSMMIMTVRRDSGNENLYITEDSDITMWTFHNVEGDRYKISTEAGSTTKYLSIGNTVSLVDEAQASEITVISNNKKQLRFSANGKSINFGGTGFTAETTSNSTSQWMYLAKTDLLSNNDLITYSADKVSVSDVPDGASVIVYTRVWNNAANGYDFYAVSHDGSLYQCYERGESIMWIGKGVNTLLWDFTEYTYEDGTPNNYYELYNPYSRKYIAPQIKDGQTLSDSKIGINLPGRGYGEYHSTIIAWDNPYYSYSGLQSDIANNRIVSGAKADADSFYFAIVKTPQNILTPVNTIDNATAGITMKMVDIRLQDDMNTLMGTTAESSPGARKGLLSTNLNSSGYPTVTNTQRVLSDLYTGETEVNHLFLESTYNATGYYEFDSSQNYATLCNPDGTVKTGTSIDFTVYEELGTTDTAERNTLKHGQFLPYNTITAEVYAVRNPENLYSALAQYNKPNSGLLPESDPRKYEKLHLINGQPNYYNAMEMSTTITQTPNGKDSWGNDIIFEFTGDDDFWFYVDGELVIDLGGIHSALKGTVNFSTGRVEVSDTKVDDIKVLYLRDIFESNYRTRNPNATDTEVSNYLAQFFDEGETVFRPYTTHTMNVFYMERGGGASNLHMRFNPNNVTPGSVMLTKTVTGSDDVDFNLVEYPYQIYYKDSNGEERLLTDYNVAINVTYQNSIQRVDYLPQYTPPGSSEVIDSVYLLHPGKSTEIHFPSDTIEYKVVECGINTEVYDTVKINSQDVTQSGIGTGTIKSFDSGWISVMNRPSIVFENHVDPDSLRTLSVQKRVYDATTGSLLTESQDQSVFDFRLYLSNGVEDTLHLAYLAKYYVTDPQGHLCVWDFSSQRLVPTSEDDYDSLTDAQKAQYTYETSMNGSISKIPVGYSVNVPNLPVGLKFMVEERDNEVPAGYKRLGYDRDSSTYLADGVNSGWVRKNQSPKMYVNNQRGWGLNVNKEWSDSSFTASHDPVYIGVFCGNSSVPVTDTVRRLTDSRLSTRYYFDSIETGYTFADYSIHEVELVNPTVDSNGNVTAYDSISRVLNDGDLTTISAVPKSSSTPSAYSYCVEYTVGTPVSTDSPESGLNNVRSDTITNLRTGGVVITLYDMKTGLVLPDGVFTLTQGSNEIGTFTADSHGRITILYEFDRNVNYTLTQTSSPGGYISIPAPVTFSVANDDTVTVGGNAPQWQNGHKSDIVGDKLIAYINVYNKPFSLEVVKVDAGTGDSLEGAHFALYRSVAGIGGQVKDYNPIPGYEDLVTDSYGVIPSVDESLEPGKYYLTETAPPTGYLLFEDDIVFTVSESDGVTINSPGHSGYLSVQGVNESIYTIEIPDEPSDEDVVLTVTKTVAGAFGDRSRDFVFTLTVDGAVPTDEYAWSKNGLVQTDSLNSGDSFTLAHNDSVSITLPKNTDITVTETDTYYITTFRLGEAAEETLKTKTFSLTEDTPLIITNTLDAPVPTGVFGVSALPYGITAAVIAAAYIIIIRSKKRKNKTAGV